MKIIQSRSFENKVKRFAKKQKNVLDKQIHKIIDTPSIGPEKKGDLRGVFVSYCQMLCTVRRRSSPGRQQI